MDRASRPTPPKADHLATGLRQDVAGHPQELAEFCRLVVACESKDGQRLLRGLRRGVGGCWLWTGHRDESGYGIIGINHSPRRIHRAVDGFLNGPLPRGLVVMHTCDVRNCGRPSHLRRGTQAENIADKMAKGRHRTSGPRFSFEQAEEIRRRYAAGGVTQNQLASELGVLRVTVMRIITGESWGTDARPYRRLSDAAVEEIRRRFGAGERQADLAREYGASRATVNHIVHGRRRGAA